MIGPRWSAVKVVFSYSINGLHVSGNLIEGNRGAGMSIVGVTHSSFEGRLVYGNVVRFNHGTGLMMDDAERYVVQRNEVHRNGAGGIYASPDTLANTFRENVACDNVEFDALDDSTLSGTNHWFDNDFCVADVLSRVHSVASEVRPSHV